MVDVSTPAAAAAAAGAHLSTLRPSGARRSVRRVVSLRLEEAMKVSKIIGPWVAVEPVLRYRSGGLHIPVGWSPRKADGGRPPQTYVALVRAIGSVTADFGVGDWVLVESMVGNPALAPERTREVRGERFRIPSPLHFDAGDVGGTPGKFLALVPVLRLPVVTDDEGAAERLARRAEIKATLYRTRTNLEHADDARLLAEADDIDRWMRAHAARRELCRRSRRLHPGEDPGRGEGILAVLDLEAVIALGADPDEIETMLNPGVVDG